MKDFIKIAILAVVVLALSPLAGFWIVALVGVVMFLLPVWAIFVASFPKVTKSLMKILCRDEHQYFIPAR